MVESMSTRVIRLFVSTAMGCILAAAIASAQVIQSPEAPDATGRLENAISTAGKYQNYIYGVVK